MILGISLLGLGFFPLYLFLPSLSYWEGKNIVFGEDAAEIGLLVVGTNVRVEIIVDSEFKKVKVGAVGPSGEVVQMKLIDEVGHIFFHVSETGVYDLTFKNDQYPEWFTRDISWKAHYYYYSDILLVLGSGFLVSGIAILFYNWFRKRDIL